MVHLHSQILLGCEKEGNFTLCDSVDGPREYDEWTKSVKGRKAPYDFTHMEFNEGNELISKLETDS